MLFKNTFEPIPALQFIYKNLQFTSTLGRHYLLDLPFCTDADTLRAEFDLMEATAAIVHNDSHRTKLSHLRNQLHQINDIRPTLSVLESGQVLDDIQLFEIKKTAILTDAIAQDLAAIQCTLFPLEEMGEVVVCLDPEHTHIPHFYIYSAYDPELAKWRERIQNAQSVQEAEQFRFQAQKVEDKVRAHLTEQLRPWGEAIARNLDTLAHLDLILAKVRLASDWHCCRPEVTDRTELVQLSNPEVAAALAEKGRRFQPIDIHFGRETILVTGANMAGKSVLLKTLALTQYLFQFGFYVPAQRASLCVVEEIITSIGDRQSELSGLSSFAVEILTIDKIIQEGRAGKRVLALVDELARTTNPEEGKVLVGNFIRLTTQLGITALVTTHYGGIEASCRRLRVKGLQLKEGQVVTTGNISDFMDYALVETDADEVPMEAFTIARLFGVDDELLAKPR